MSKFGLVLFFIMLGFSLCYGQQSERLEWKEVASDELKFKATFPGAPKTSVDALDAKLGKRYAHWFIVTLPQRFFGVSVTDFPNLPLMLKKDQLKSNYDNLRDGVIKQTGFKLVGERDIRLGEQFGREIVLSNDKETIKNRMFLVRQRLFQSITTMQTSLLKDEAAQKDATKFLDSFQFVQDKDKSSAKD
jgi:hypothetical protein